MSESVAVMCGGVGAARLLRGLIRAVDPTTVTAIINTADDIELHGLHVSPDIDTCVYTLAEAINPETSWGLAGETWHAMEALGRYGGVTWFNLGDKDLGTHLYRSQRLSEGASLAEVTAEIANAWGLRLKMVPVTNDSIRTRVVVPDEGDISFQEYFVRRQHDVPVTEVRFEGAAECQPAPGVIEAISQSEHVIVAPSNPIVSIGPLLAVPGVQDALSARRDNVVAVSPIVAGAALKGPAARMLEELGHEPSAVGVAQLYREFASVLAIDEADRHLASQVEAVGMRALVLPTIMKSAEDAAALATALIRRGA